MTQSPEVLVVEGTVREGRKSVHAARKTVEMLEQKGVSARLFDIAEKDIPMLKTRTYADDGEAPEDVKEFSELVEKAKCVVLVSPEYNHSYTGALKNLLDHLYPEYDGKLFGFVTVSSGGFGGVRCLEDLQTLALTLGGDPGPSLPVSGVNAVFDENGELQDDDYRERFDSFAEEIAGQIEN
jgi:NAD(P)H-dependent FMN reductase